MVLRNSGRVGSRRFLSPFLEREAPVSEDAGAFLFSGYHSEQECYASVYLPLSSVYFPVLLFISFFLVILLLSLRNKTGEKRYFL